MGLFYLVLCHFSTYATILPCYVCTYMKSLSKDSRAKTLKGRRWNVKKKERMDAPLLEPQHPTRTSSIPLKASPFDSISLFLPFSKRYKTSGSCNNDAQPRRRKRDDVAVRRSCLPFSLASHPRATRGKRETP